MRAAGVAESELPQYDPACQDAWAKYTTARRDKGGSLGLPPGPPAATAEHGTVQRWRAHVRERRRLRAQGVPEQELPPIDQGCRDAWRRYNAGLKKPKRRKKRAKVARASRPLPEETRVEHGTAEGLKMHRRQRRRLRAAGVAERDLPPICDACASEALRIKVLNAQHRPDNCGAAFGTFVQHECRLPRGHEGDHRTFAQLKKT